MDNDTPLNADQETPVPVKKATSRVSQTCVKAQPQKVTFQVATAIKKKLIAAEGHAVEVHARVRPILPADLEKGKQQALDVDTEDDRLVIKVKLPGGQEARFGELDSILGPDATSQVVFEGVGRKGAEQVLRGCNYTILMYGQTGSGKTYTAFGCQASDPPECGLLQHIGNFVDAILKGSTGARVSVLVLEVYNEELFVLLNASGVEKRSLGKKVYNARLADVKPLDVSSANEAAQRIMDALQKRTVDATASNSNSSRSHAVVRLIVDQPDVAGPSGRGVSASLFLVDLAGSESYEQAIKSSQELPNSKFSASNPGKPGADLNNGKTGSGGNTKSVQQNETIAINTSLHFLETVFNSLVCGSHVSYRNSMLTHVLQEGLDPSKARVAVVTTVSPFGCDANVSKATLTFGQRARNVRTYAEVNTMARTMRSRDDDELRQRLEEAKAINFILQQQLVDFQEEKISGANRSARLEAFQADLQRMTAAYGEVQAAAMGYKASAAKAEAALAAERSEYAAAVARLAEMDAENAKLREEVNTAKKRAQEALAAQEWLARESQQAAAAVRARAQKESEDLRKLLDTTSADLADASDQITVMKGQLAATESRELQLKEQVERLKADAAAVRIAAENAAAERAAAEAEAASIRAAAEADATRHRQELLQEAVAQVQALEARLVEAEQQSWLSKQEADSRAVAAEQSTESKVNELTLRLATAEAQVQLLQQSLADARQTVDAQASRLQQQEQQLARVQETSVGELEGAHAVVAAVQQEVGEARAAAAMYEQHARHFQEEASQLRVQSKEEAAALERQCTDLQDEVLSLQAALQKREEEAVAKQKALDGALVGVKELDSRREAAESALKAALAELQEVRKEHTTALQAARTSAAQQSRAAADADLAQQLTPLRAEAERLRATNSLQEEQLSRLQSQVSAHAAAASQASDQAASRAAECERLSGELSDVARRLAEAEAATARLQALYNRDTAPRRDSTKQLEERIKALETMQMRMAEDHKGQLELKDKLIHKLQLMNQHQADLDRARQDTSLPSYSDQGVPYGSPVPFEATPTRSDAGFRGPAGDDMETPNSVATTTGGMPVMLNRTTTLGAAALRRNNKTAKTPDAGMATPPTGGPMSRLGGVIPEASTSPVLVGLHAALGTPITTPGPPEPRLTPQSASHIDGELLAKIAQRKARDGTEQFSTTSALRNKMNL